MAYWRQMAVPSADDLLQTPLAAPRQRSKFDSTVETSVRVPTTLEVGHAVRGSRTSHTEAFQRANLCACARRCSGSSTSSSHMRWCSLHPARPSGTASLGLVHACRACREDEPAAAQAPQVRRGGPRACERAPVATHSPRRRRSARVVIVQRLQQPKDGEAEKRSHAGKAAFHFQDHVLSAFGCFHYVLCFRLFSFVLLLMVLFSQKF